MAKSGKCTITRDSYSIPNNTSTITVKGIITTTGESYRGDHRTGSYTIKQGSTVLKTGSFTQGAPANSTTTLFSVTLTVYHKSDGSSDAITATYNYDSGWCTGSGSLALGTIPRQATITSAPNFDDESNPAISYSNPAKNVVSSLQACIASTDGKTIYVPYRDISKTGTSYTFSLTDAERTALRNACANAKSMNVKFYIKTVISDATYYSTSQKTLSIVNAMPTISASAEDVNSATVALTGDKSIFVKYFSNISVAMTATALKGATIKSYAIACGDKSISKASGTINNVESGTVTFSVTDSRGNTSSVSLIKTMIAYTPLTCVLQNEQPSADGDMNFNVNGNCFNGSFGTASNAISIQYRYKSEKDDAYSDWITMDNPTFSSGKYTAVGAVTGLDYSLQYKFQARIVDSLSSVTTKEYDVVIKPVFYWGKYKFFFNVPIIIQGDFVSDFVIEQGISGIWKYQKWKNGFAELFGKIPVDNVAVATAYGALFRSSEVVYESSEYTYPFSFSENPTVMVSFATTGGGRKIAELHGNGYNSSPPMCFLVGAASSDSVSGYVNITVKGRWK